MANGINHRLGSPLGRPEIDRRRFLGDGATAAAAVVLGPFLAACSSTKTSSAPAAPAPSDDGSPATGTLRIKNWPQYMADGVIAEFQKATGLTVDYSDDFNDNEAWWFEVRKKLESREEIGADLVVPTTFLAARLKRLGWLNEIRDSRVPNKKNLRPDLLNASVDPGCKFMAPYMSGIVGLAYNRAVTGRDITGLDDLRDPEFKGKVSLFTDTQDALGMFMLGRNSSLEDPTMAAVQDAIDQVKKLKMMGQVGRFTGNDYFDGLIAGDIAVAQAYSGDVAQLQTGHPDLRFVIPQSGGTTFVDTMVIPRTAENQKAAEAWINYVYDRANYAKLVAFVQYIPVLSDMTDELTKIDRKLATNPLVNPPRSTLDRLKAWGPLTDTQVQEFNTAYAAVSAGSS